MLPLPFLNRCSSWRLCMSTASSASRPPTRLPPTAATTVAQSIYGPLMGQNAGERHALHRAINGCSALATRKRVRRGSALPEQTAAAVR
jgi:hypothetical protein